MGVFAQTTATITCSTTKVAKQVHSTLKKLKKMSDENGNFQFAYLHQIQNTVFFDHSSGRIQNLEYQVDKVWEVISHLDGVLEINAPFLSEADGVFHQKEDTNN